MKTYLSKDFIIRFTVFFTGILVAVLGMFGLQNKFDAILSKKSSFNNLINIIEDHNQGVYEKNMAIENLVHKYPEQASMVAQKWISTSNSELQQHGITILAKNKNTIFIDKIKELSHHKNLQVRLKSYEALYKLKDPDLVIELQKKVNKKIALKEYLKINEILFIANSEETNKKQITDNLFKRLKSSNNSEKYDLLSLISVLDPQNSRLRNELENTLKTSNSNNLFPLAISVLAKEKNLWLSKNIEKFLLNKDNHIQLVALNSLLVLCPSHLNKLLKNFFAKEKDSKLLSFSVKIKNKITKESLCLSSN